MAKGNSIATNRNASRLYTFSDPTEAGIQLTGTEVKSLRNGKCNLQDGFARFEKGELFLYNVHIATYEEGNIFNHEPTRPRKLLLHKRELQRYFGLMTQKGLTIIPLKVYFKHGIAKCQIAIGKTKKIHDRRQDIKKRIVQKEIDRAIKNRNR